MNESLERALEKYGNFVDSRKTTKGKVIAFIPGFLGLMVATPFIAVDFVRRVS